MGRRRRLKQFLADPYVCESYEEGGLSHLRLTSSLYTLCRRRVLTNHRPDVYQVKTFPTCFLCIAETFQ